MVHRSGIVCSGSLRANDWTSMSLWALNHILKVPSCGWSEWCDVISRVKVGGTSSPCSGQVGLWLWGHHCHVHSQSDQSSMDLLWHTLAYSCVMLSKHSWTSVLLLRSVLEHLLASLSAINPGNFSAAVSNTGYFWRRIRWRHKSSNTVSLNLKGERKS